MSYEPRLDVEPVIQHHTAAPTAAGSVEVGFRLQRHQNESARGAQPSQSDRDEPADRGLGRQAAGCCEGVEAVARKLVSRDIIPDVPGLDALGQQVSDQFAELLLRPGDVLLSMQECRQFGGVALVLNERVSLEHSFEPLGSVASLVSEFSEMFEVAGDVTFVPGDQDRFDVWEVLVQRRTSDAGLLGDLRHRHRPQPVLGHQRRSSVQDRVAHRAAVRLDGLGPQLRHCPSIRDGWRRDTMDLQ